MRKLARYKTRILEENPFHIRNPEPEEELRLFGQSVIRHQEVPLIIRPDKVILDGHRRRAGVMLHNPEFELECIETDEDLDPTEIQLITATQKNLGPYEKFKAMTQWLEAHPNATSALLAERVSLDPSTVSKILSLSRCIPAVQELAAAGALGITEWNAFAKESEKRQHELLALRLEGKITGRDALETHRHKERNGTPAVRVSRIKCPLPSGVVVQVSGEGITLDDMIQEMAELLKHAKRASEQNLDVRTFEKMCRDKAKK